MEEKQEPSEREILWRQYNLYIELFKFYLTLALKANIFYYVLTGAILTYYFANSEKELIKHSLLLPGILGIIMGGMFMYGAFLIKILKREVHHIKKELNLKTPPDFNVLFVFLIIFGIMIIIVGVLILRYVPFTLR